VTKPFRRWQILKAHFDMSETDPPSKVLITGATGFIGSHVLKKFASTNYQILALRREHSHPCINIDREPQWLVKSLDQVDAEDLQDVKVLVHLASVGVSPKRATWEELFYWNVSVFVRLMEQAKHAGVTRLVVTGTFAEYGRSADRYDFIPVDAPLLPTTAYAASKAAAFMAAWSYAVEMKLELCYLRIFSAYGEGQFAGNFWPALREAARAGQDFPMTLGEQIRDYIPVEDVADTVLQSAFRGDVQAGNPLVLNVGSGVPVSMRAFAESWWSRWQASGKLLPGAVPYRTNEPMRFVPAMVGSR
jgi:nucleoside-diphosphate-sugar epimerase